MATHPISYLHHTPEFYLDLQGAPEGGEIAVIQYKCCLCKYFLETGSSKCFLTAVLSDNSLGWSGNEAIISLQSSAQTGLRIDIGALVAPLPLLLSVTPTQGYKILGFLILSH